MNLESFAVGIVTMVVFFLAIVTVVGILKVTALAKDVLKLKRRLEDDEREFSREINMVEQTLSNQINHTERNLFDAIETNHRHDTSYTDSRIDKLIDTYFDFEKFKKKNILKD
jgi:predicted Holliday junction resolvase-like endonuclease